MGTNGKKYKDADEAIAMLARNKAKVGVKSVAAVRPGLKMLGAMDYLAHYCGYVCVIKQEDR
jgi:hypothetical protein